MSSGMYVGTYSNGRYNEMGFNPQGSMYFTQGQPTPYMQPMMPAYPMPMYMQPMPLTPAQPQATPVVTKPATT